MAKVVRIAAGVGLALLAGPVGIGVFHSLAVTSAMISTGLSVSLGGLAALLRGAPKSGAMGSGRDVLIRDPIAPWRIIYGETRVGGVIVFAEATGTNNEFLHLVIVHCSGEIEDITNLYFITENGVENIPVDGNGDATGRFAGFVHWEKRLGESSQTAYSSLVSATGGKWSNDHKGNGHAHSYVRLKWNQELFPYGMPQMQFQVKGRKLFDPRSSTTAYSSNWALAVRDYLTDSTYGLGLDASALDSTAMNAAANLADESVEIPVSPGTEPRYTVNGVITTSAQLRDNILALLGAGAGNLNYSAGKWFLYGGAWREPAETLTDADFIGPLEVSSRIARRDRINGVKGTFISPLQKYQPTDFPPRQDTSAVSDDGFTAWADINLPLTTSEYAAERLAQLVLNRARKEITVKARCRLRAYTLVPSDTVRLTHPRFGWSNKTFEVEDVVWAVEKDEQDRRALVLDLVLRESDEDVYGFTDPASVEAVAELNLARVAAGLWGMGDIADGDGFYRPRTDINLSGDLPYNGDFEEFPDDRDVARGWTRDFGAGTGDYARSEDPWRGDFAQELHGGNQGAGIGSRPFGVQPGVKYRLSCRAKIDATHSTDGFYVRVLWYSDDIDLTEFGSSQISYEDIVEGTDNNFASVGADTYKLFSGEVTAPAGARFARIALYSWTDPGAARVITVDTVSMAPATLPPASVAYRPTSNPLTATDAGATATVSIASFTMRTAYGDLSLNSGSITALDFATLYYIYYDDPGYAGGSPAGGYQATTTKEAAFAGLGRFFVGSILTPADGGIDTTGNNDGGGSAAQTGALAIYLPASATRNTNGNGSITDPGTAIDGKTGTYMSSSVTAAGGGNTTQAILSGFFPLRKSRKSLLLKIRSEVPTSGPGMVHAIRVVLKGTEPPSLPWIPNDKVIFVFNTTNATRALQTDVIDLIEESGDPYFDISKVQIFVEVSDSVNSSGSAEVRVYDIWIEEQS